jgi:hypothetical protein
MLTIGMISIDNQTTRTVSIIWFIVSLSAMKPRVEHDKSALEVFVFKSL